MSRVRCAGIKTEALLEMALQQVHTLDALAQKVLVGQNPNPSELQLSEIRFHMDLARQFLCSYQAKIKDLDYQTKRYKRAKAASAKA
jgi:hypothetical protein